MVEPPFVEHHGRKYLTASGLRAWSQFPAPLHLTLWHRFICWLRGHRPIYLDEPGFVLCARCAFLWHMGKPVAFIPRRRA